ncbi:MAG: O-antigen ligase family protein [Thermoleophilaceae bacterium]|nr:O-antigen ligase family protein [Thermoleophilaceae bacterium]
MRRGSLLAGAVVLLATPAVLAFYAGGFFDGSRATAAVLVWGLVLLLAIAGPLPLPAGRAGRVAVAGLAGLAAWSLLSITWAPVAGPAVDGAQRAVLYLGAFLAAIGLLRDPRARSAAEPVLALGTVVVLGYSLAGRLLPGVFHFYASFGAGARLEQPVSYWNSLGLLAGMGLVLCARLAGDAGRDAYMRTLAAAATPLLGLGLYLTYSRGAIAATLLGVLFLLAIAPTRAQLAAVAGSAVGTTVAAAVSQLLPGVARLEGTRAELESNGLVMVVVLALLMVAAGAAGWWLATRARGASERLPFAGSLPALARVVTLLCLAGLVVGGLRENGGEAPPEGRPSDQSRLTEVGSLRYEYWKVGVGALDDHPLRGSGLGSFRVIWREEREIDELATEVHSLPLETLLELGVVGALLLAAFVGGVAVAARAALRAGSPVAAGAAICIMWALHSTIDWNWQLPAVTLPAVLMAGALVAAAEPSESAAPADTRDDADSTVPLVAA